MSMNCQYKAAHMYIFLLNCYLRCLNRECTFNGDCTFNGSVPVSIKQRYGNEFGKVLTKFL